MRTISVLDTIAGAKKCEIVLRDVKNMNSYTHFDDVEVWSPTTNPVGGLIFDGINDYIELATTLKMDSADWAISWWMKRTSGVTSSIVSEFKDDTSGKGFIVTSGNNINVYSSTLGIWNVSLATGITVSDGEWHHYVINFSSTATFLYVDNTLVDTDTPNIDTSAFDVNFVGGKYSTYFSGSLYHIRIFNTTIESDEINKLYNGIYTTSCYAFYTLTQSIANDDGIYDRYEISHGTSYTSSGVKGSLPLDTSPLNEFIAFKGQIESMLPDYDTDTLSIICRDYTGGLLSRACVESYTTQLRSYIVNDIILKYGSVMSRRNINDSPAGTTLSYLFKTSAWDAVIKCAKEDGYRFWSDVDKDFHYHEKGYLNSGITLEVGVDNILSYNINEQGSEVVNRVMVYGKETAGSQIVIMVEDLDSQSRYGMVHEKRIVDLSLETEADAITVGEKYLDEHSYILEIIEIKLIGNETIAAGELLTLVIPDLNIDDSYLIIDKQLMYPKGYISIKVAKYAKNLEGLISDMVDKILMLERYFMEETSTVTKIYRINESVLYTDCLIIDKRATNDSFKIGVESKCKIGVAKIGGRGNEWTEVYSSCENVLYDNVVQGSDNIVDSLGNNIVVYK